MTAAQEEGVAAAFAHRAVTAAMVLGVLRPARGMRVTVGPLSAFAAAATGRADLVVFTDDGSTDDVGTAMVRVREGLADGGVVAWMVGSRVTQALVTASREHHAQVSALTSRDDAYARAMAWAAARASSVTLAPALEPERLAQVVAAAGAAGLALVEPESAVIAPGLARVRGLRSPRARALLATVALGAVARPLLFVPSARAPKGGLARPKTERLADGWVSEGAAPAASGGDEKPHGELMRAALDVLADAARAGEPARSFKELLREARERWSNGARARGERATPGAGDAATLAAALHRLAADERVTLYALAPHDPGWTSTLLPGRLTDLRSPA